MDYGFDWAINILLSPAMFCALAYINEQKTGRRLFQPCGIGNRKNLPPASGKLELLVRN